MMDAQQSAQRPLAPLYATTRASVPGRSGDPGTTAPTALLASSGNEAELHQQRPKRVACSECRQAKVRCDSSDNYGSKPCVRCERFSLECHVDSNYKRVNKRIKIQELADQVEQLRSVVDHHARPEDPRRTEGDVQPPVNSMDSPHSSDGRHISIRQPSPQFLPNECSTESESHVSQSHQVVQESNLRPRSSQLERIGNNSRHSSSSLISPRCLEGVELNSRQISHIFHDFFEHYHHFLEILDPSLSPDQYYDRSPLLFWCIITVSGRRCEDDAALLATLSPCVIKLLWSTISVLPHSRFTIQAMLLVSNWSFPTSSMSTDMSFMLVSIAKSSSMQLGLHRPETAQDFLRVRTQFNTHEFQEVVKVWVGCFVVSQSVTTSIGQLSFFPCDWTINRACETGNKYTLPENFRHHLLIHKFIARVNSVMAGNDASPTGSPSENESCVLMAILERDLVDLERQIGHKLTATHEVLLSIAYLQLRLYYFFITSDSGVRKTGLLKAYATSLTVIEKAVDADAKYNFIQYAPILYSQMLTMAAMMLMKIINSSYASYVDTEAGKRAFNIVLAMLRKGSVENNDLRGRACAILSQLWGVHHSLTLRREQEPDLKVKSRWGASLLHDLLWMWREEFGGQRATLPMIGISAPAQSAGQATTVTDSTPELTPDDHTHDDDWSIQNMGSQSRVAGEQRPLYMTNDDFDSMGDLTGPIQDIDWLQDIGFASLVPVDVDFYPTTMPHF